MKNHLSLGKNNTILIALFLFLSIQVFGQNPTANFTVGTTEGCATLVVTLNNTSTGGPFSNVSWDFGNGNTLSGNPAVNPVLNNPTVTYPNSGTFTVTLTVTNAAGTDTETQSNVITVFGRPTANFSASSTTGCAPFTPDFTDLSTIGGSGSPIVEWNWNFGNGAFGSGQNPTNPTYNQSGSYTVTLNVVDQNGCENTATQTNYIVITGPNASFTASPTSGCTPPLTVNFTNNSTPSGTLTYNWNFGNGNTSTAELPGPQTYTNSQNYTVSLIVTDGQGCTDSAGQNILLQPYQAEFLFPASGCVPFQAAFTNSSDPGTTNFQWNFGDPGSGNQNQSFSQNPSHIFNTPGVYTVRLIGRNQQNCTDTVTHQITVHDLPQINASPIDSFGCTLPFTTTFQDQTTGATTWNWSFFDEDNNLLGVGNLENTPFTFTEEGSYTYAISVVDNNGCSNSDTVPNGIRILLPIANFTTDTPGGCFPLPVVFTDSSVFTPVANSWSWNFGDGTSGIGSTITHTFTDTGVYDVVLTATNALGCSDQDTLQILVGQLPIASFSFTPDSVCFRTEIQFTDESTGPVSEWQWSFGSEDQNPITVLPDTGYNDVTLTINHNLCFDDTTVQNAIYYLPPKAQISLSDSTFCKEEIPVFVQPRDSSELRGPGVFFWDFGFDNLQNDTSNLQFPPGITYTDPGVYTIKLIVKDLETGCVDSTIKIVSLDLFELQPTVNPTTGCQPLETTFFGLYTNVTPATVQGYIWNFGDSPIPLITNDLNVQHTYNSSGNFTAEVTAINSYGCRDTAQVSVSVSARPVAQIASSDSLVCAPGQGLFTDASTPGPGQTITSWHWHNRQNQIGSNSTFSINYGFVYQDTISLYVTDAAGCNSDTTYFPVQVSRATAAFVPPNQVCSGTTFLINSTQSGGPGPLQYEWDFGDGTTGAINNPSHSYDVTTTDTFTISLIITDNFGCKDTAEQNITVSSPQADFEGTLTVSQCPPFFAQFTNDASSDAIQVTYIWDDQTPNTIQNTGQITDTVSHVFTFPGVYTVTQIVTTQAGCRDTLERVDYIEVGGPTATFSFNPTNSECAPVTVTFQANGIGNVEQFFWVFGDGSIDTISGPNVTHTYNLAGDFAPVLIIRDSLNLAAGDTTYCSVTVLSDILSIRGPILNFTADSTQLCGPYGVTFFNNTSIPTGVNVTGWEWNFGDGSTSTEQNPGVHEYTQAGNYTVTLTATTSGGCVYTLPLPNFIQFFQGPPIFFPDTSLSQCPAACIDLTANLVGLPLAISHYEWNLIDTIIEDQNSVSWCYTEPGLYEPSFTADFVNGCSFTYNTNASINVWNTPDASFTSFPVLAGNKIKGMEFTNTSVGSDSIVWVFGDGSPNEYANQVAHTYEDTGAYEVLLIAFSDSGCADTASFKLQVEESIQVPNVFTPNDDGFNDFFEFNIPGETDCLTLDVYDRWGKLKYHSDQFQNDWGGTDQNGKKLNPDTYYYILNFCRRFTITGFVMIVYDNK